MVKIEVNTEIDGSEKGEKMVRWKIKVNETGRTKDNSRFECLL